MNKQKIIIIKHCRTSTTPRQNSSLKTPILSIDTPKMMMSGLAGVARVVAAGVGRNEGSLLVGLVGGMGEEGVEEE